MTGSKSLPILSLSLFALACYGGCKLVEKEPSYEPDTAEDTGVDTGDAVDPTAGKTVGEPCTPDAAGYHDCRWGLECVSGACKAVGDTPEGYECVTSAECGEGLYCSFAGLCAEAGAGAVNEQCSTGADCEPGLYCRILGVVGVCAEPGTGDVRASCADQGDCMAGLICSSLGKCAAASRLFGFRFWQGASCETSLSDSDPLLLFEIPRDDVTEFFRLPFPNDIRAPGGKLHLAGFPRPGPGLVGFDIVDRIVDAVERSQTGFSTIPTVFFRFGKAVESGSITTTGDAPSLRFVDIDPESPHYGQGQSYSWYVTDGGGKYICPRWVSLRVAWDHPLAPATTYGVIFTDDLTDTEGNAIRRSPDFDLVMSESEPTDAVERNAWNAYAPLRAYVAAEGIDPDTVVGGTVFTTQDTVSLLPALREAVHAEELPVPAELTLCDGASTSPCDDGLEGDDHVRGCFDVSAAVYELHMRVPVPIVQRGTRPFLSPADGGGVAVDGDGEPEVQGTEEVCVSLTIPKNGAVTMPAEGWPLMIYGHGTGGTFRSSVANAGEPLANIDVDGTHVGVAVAGWDGPMHGERRGSEFDPEALFYNFANPEAAQGNLYQGAVDIFALVRAFKALVIPAGESPTGAEIRFDPTHIMLAGHSQGSQLVPLAAPYEPDSRLVVLSGAGGGLVLSLLEKTQPVDVKTGIAIALMEVADQGIKTIRDNHPAMALMQGFFDPVDPLNHARALFTAPYADYEPQHVLHVYGIDDHYTPPPTIEKLAKVMKVDQVAPIISSFKLTELEPPVSGNKKGGTITGALFQAQPEGYDGHFVMFRNAAAKERFRQFVGTWLVGGMPVVIAN